MNDGGPAFPVETNGNGEGKQTGPNTGWDVGMSLRDYLAAKALPVFIAYMHRTDDCEYRIDAAARDAYRAADAMLEARA